MTLILIKPGAEVNWIRTYPEQVLVVTRYRVPAAEAEQFHGLAREALAALVARPGCLAARVARSIDDPGLWVLASEWLTVGSYRRALSSAEVKLRAVPLMYRCVDEPTAFEELTTWNPGVGLSEYESDVAADPVG